MAYLGNEPDVIKTAETVTNTANNTTNETVYLVFSDAQGATTALETDSSLTYNPSTNLLSVAGVIKSTSGGITFPDSTTQTSAGYSTSDINTYIDRGYVTSENASNLADGWYTIATNTGNRAIAEFAIWDTASGDHQHVLFNATHSFGATDSNSINVFANSAYSGTNFRYIRIKEGGTYEGAALQVYIEGSTNAVNAAIVGANVQTDGWVLKDWIADATDPGDVDNWGSMTEAVNVDLDNISAGGIMTSGKIYSYGNILSTSSIEATTSVQTGIINATTHTGTTGTFSGNVTASYLVGTATEALYADLAENYQADDTYEPGTVLVFGGSAEVTATNKTHDTRVAGVVSTNPAYLMNKDSGNTSLGLTGRLPCMVKGPVDKGTLLVTSDTPGVAQALNDAYYKPGCVVGKSMNTLTDSSIELIEIAVGRF